jgi:hypothetical protein
MPAEPIQVHPAGEVEGERGAVAANEGADNASEWKKPAPGVVHPPPAYGRWRGSVLANPDLLHWQAVHDPSGAALDAKQALPSPAYRAESDEDNHNRQLSAAEVAHQQSAESLPPVYTSPLRVRPAVAETIQVQTVEPEMIEIRMVSVGRQA